MKDSSLAYLFIYIVVVCGLVMFSRWIASDYDTRLTKQILEMSVPNAVKSIQGHHEVMSNVGEEN